MQSWLLNIDRVSAALGKTFAWFIVLLTGAIVYEVFARYLFRAPTTWAFDVSYMLYGTLFMMAGAYTLSREGHVRADFLYRIAPVRVQAALDLALYLLFFFPGMAALVWFGWDFFALSFWQNERSSISPNGPLIWPFKFVIPFAAAAMILQGIAETIRAWIALGTGAWPPRLSDVEEMEVLAIKQAQAARASEAAR
ncbi:MAG: TRAP transporter small permease subunit [Acetobacteraceae bacterium]|nr:TRAP transporter small permease subunit [Acetobacteraceae bacterium]MCX7686257.1 TRAP transporter small permease subunit [Acetobacteraceae bacterium]